MSCPRWIIVLVIAVMLLGMSSRTMAEMEASEKDVAVRKLGVAWNIAADRKMENIGGVYEPEGLDKYTKRYFDQLSAKVDELSMKIDKLSEQITKLNALASKKDAPKESSQGRIV